MANQASVCGMEAGNKLKQYLKDYGESRIEFTKRSGLSKSLIDKIISRGQHDVLQSTMQIIFDCTDGFVRFDDWQRDSVE